MKRLNKVILVGLVVHDPEVKYTASGIPVRRFSLATNERYKDKSGKFHERAEWHNIVVWRKLAEIVGEFVSEGAPIYRRQTPNYKLGRPAERRKEIPD